MAFFEWVTEHVGQRVTFEHVHWNYGSDGVETHELRGMQNDVLLLGTSDQSAPSGTPLREGWSTAPSVQGVYQLIARIKWIEAQGRDRVECSLGDDCVISYDDPTDPASHDGRPCAIHDMPRWRLSDEEHARVHRTNDGWIFHGYRDALLGDLRCINCGNGAELMIERYGDDCTWRTTAPGCTKCFEARGILWPLTYTSDMKCRVGCGNAGIALFHRPYNAVGWYCEQHVPTLIPTVIELPLPLQTKCKACLNWATKLVSWSKPDGDWSGDCILCDQCVSKVTAVTEGATQRGDG